MESKPPRSPSGRFLPTGRPPTEEPDRTVGLIYTYTSSARATNSARMMNVGKLGTRIKRTIAIVN